MFDLRKISKEFVGALLFHVSRQFHPQILLLFRLYLPWLFLAFRLPLQFLMHNLPIDHLHIDKIRQSVQLGHQVHISEFFQVLVSKIEVLSCLAYATVTASCIKAAKRPRRLLWGSNPWATKYQFWVGPDHWATGSRIIIWWIRQFLFEKS